MSERDISLQTAANGYARITTLSRSQRRSLDLLLMFRYGFWRWGVTIPAIKDEAIYELALQQPRDVEALGRLRTIPRGFDLRKT